MRGRAVIARAASAAVAVLLSLLLGTAGPAAALTADRPAPTRAEQSAPAEDPAEERQQDSQRGSAAHTPCAQTPVGRPECRGAPAARRRRVPSCSPARPADPGPGSRPGRLTLALQVFRC